MPLLTPHANDSPTLRKAATLAPKTLTGNSGEFDGMDVTCKVEVAAREALQELRTSDPNAAKALDAAMAEMPQVGQTFQNFHLDLELGRGAFAHVFLARQTGLAERYVALKIAVDLNGESQRLAQLQHTNIVPIYSEHRVGDLHAVCMPYCGCTTLGDVLKALRLHDSLPTSGRQLVSTLVNRQSTLRTGVDHSHSGLHSHSGSERSSGRHPATSGKIAPAVAVAPGNLSKLEKMSYVDAILWMVARLADGLAHAHERGIIHRDLKPANILICDDGQPMLLDFNLSEDTKTRGPGTIALVGGTLPYMAPEQLIAFRDSHGQVDGRADIYALGLMAYHLLTGHHAFKVRRGASRDMLPKMLVDREGPPPRLIPFNRALSPAVEAIIRHCLEPDPAKRYANASELAEDIERHRANLPLKHVREPSPLERAVKWGRRNPKFVSPTAFSFLIAAALLVAIAASVEWSREQKKREVAALHALAHTRLHDFQHDYQLAQDLLTTDDPAQVAEGLKLGETALRKYEVLDKADWLEQPIVKELAPPERDRLKADVGQVAFLMARAVHFQPTPDEGAAKKMNQLAEAHLDDNAKPALAQQLNALNRPERPPLNDAASEAKRMKFLLESAAGLNPRGRFLLACEHVAQGRPRDALPLLDGIVAEEPNDFGGWYLKARCHQMLDQDVEALAAYGTAIALRPTYARSYVARANIYYGQRKNLDQARQDLDQAVRLQPSLLDARIDRALVLFALGKSKEALPDLDWALQRPDVPARVWFIRSRVKRTLNDHVGADRDHQEGLRTEPNDAISWVSRGIAKLPTDAEGALADFIRAEQVYPRCLDALHNQAYIYSVRLKKPDEAIAALERLLNFFPDNQQALGYRAILLARSGKTDEAVTEARNLAKMTLNPEHLYRAACALSLASEKNPALKPEALRLLATALTRGWGQDKLDSDKDLNPIRDTAEFKQFVAYSRTMRIWSLPVIR